MGVERLDMSKLTAQSKAWKDSVTAVERWDTSRGIVPSDERKPSLKCKMALGVVSGKC